MWTARQIAPIGTTSLRSSTIQKRVSISMFHLLNVIRIMFIRVLMIAYASFARSQPYIYVDEN